MYSTELCSVLVKMMKAKVPLHGTIRFGMVLIFHNWMEHVTTIVSIKL